MRKHRQQTFAALARLGITDADAASLVRASATLSTWAEHECNGAIQRDGDDGEGVPYWYNTNTGRRICRTSDREKGALKRARSIAQKYGMEIYHQGDPRGVAVYLLRPGDVPAGAAAGSYYTRGVAVCP